MKNTKKVMTTSLLMALMCAAAATMASAKPVKANGQLAVRDVLTADISKDVTGRFVKRQADVEAMNVISDVKAQISDVVDGVRHIRFVAAIDSHKYADAKFNILVKDGDKIVKTFADKTVTTAYTHIEANGKVLSAAEAFGDEKYNFMLAYTINNVPAEAWGYTFEVTAAIKTADAEGYTVSDAATKSINKVEFDDAIGMNSVEMVNDATYPWKLSVVNGSASLESTIQGKKSTTTTVRFTAKKDTIMSFDWYVSSESSSWDYLKITNETTGVTYVKMGGVFGDNEGYRGKVAVQLAAGDVVDFAYVKDSSGDKGEDKGVISNLHFTDGIVTPKITKVYNDGVTENTTTTVDLLGTVGIDTLAAPENVRGDQFEFEAWYYDAAFTRLVDKDDLCARENITLYAKWLEKVTVTFVVPEGSSEVAPVTVWSGSAITVEDPKLDKHVFSGWYTDAGFTQMVDLSAGVNTSCTLYAKFDTMPVGLAKDVAYEIVFGEGEHVWSTTGATTIEEKQDYFFKFVPTITETYTVLYSNYKVVGGNTTSKYYSRMWIEDANGNVVAADFDEKTNVKLTAGETYYLIFNGGKSNSSYNTWGTFDLSMYYFDHDDEASSINYTLGETVTMEPGTFIYKHEKTVYKFVSSETTNYKLSLSAETSTRVIVYKNKIGGTTVANTYYVTSGTKSVDFPVTAGETYYLSLELNGWSNNELASETIRFSVTEYSVGYASNNPQVVALEETSTLDLTEGYTKYTKITVPQNDTYKVVISGGTSSYTKSVAIYSSNNMNSAIKTITCKTTEDSVTYLELEAGDYTLVSKYTANPSNITGANYDVIISNVLSGETLLKPITVNLPAVNAEAIEGINGTGYYAFTTGTETVFHFFTANNNTATIDILTVDGTNVTSSVDGTVYAKLTANTTYVLYVSGENLVVTHNTVDSVVDGKSADTAYTFGVDSSSLPIPAQGSYEVWYKFTATESGTYRFYSLNIPASANIDTKGFLYNESDTKSYLKQNEDGRTSVQALGGYVYDFYFTYDLVEGETYYIKVTYTVGVGDLLAEDGAELRLVVEKL